MWDAWMDRHDYVGHLEVWDTEWIGMIMWDTWDTNWIGMIMWDAWMCEALGYVRRSEMWDTEWIGMIMWDTWDTKWIGMICGTHECARQLDMTLEWIGMILLDARICEALICAGLEAWCTEWIGMIMWDNRGRETPDEQALGYVRRPNVWGTWIRETPEWIDMIMWGTWRAWHWMNRHDYVRHLEVWDTELIDTLICWRQIC